MNRLSISYDGRGSWRLDGEAVGPTRIFSALPAALDDARELTNAAEALIEVRVDGVYACVHQEQGWPHRICAPLKTAA
jgi:hypothetical protein